MSERKRAFIQRASTYRVRDREQVCPWCGEAIRSWMGSHEERDEAFGNMPRLVHDDCSGDTNDEATEGWRTVG